MNIFVSGIGGVAMGPLALLARDNGHTVRGSDITASLTTEELTKAGIPIQFEQTVDALRAAHEKVPIEWYVYTSALPDNHPELEAARELGIRTSKRDEFLGELLTETDLQLIAISGTHGKTTTTAMMIWTLEQLNLPISYSVGSQLPWGPSGTYEPGSKYFVYECDEFDRNFLQFRPELSIITSLGYDHPDTYPSESEYKIAFRQFIKQSAAVILWQIDTDWLQDNSLQSWALQENEVIPLALPGEHNRRNATLVLKALERLHIGDDETNRSAIESFPGVRRRFEKLAENLYTDYGHTPVEIAATLQLAHELNKQTVLIYQPHQNIRQHEVREQYTDAVFSSAEEVYWLPTYQSREDPDLELLTPKQLTSNLTTTTLHISDLGDELWHAITRHLDDGKLVLCMGAGSIDSWVRERLQS